MNSSFNRWKFLITACLVNFCTGSIYAWSVFAGPKAEQMSQLQNILYTPGDLSIVFGVANAVGPLPMIFGGFINDRFGPGWLMTIGGLLIGSGLFLSGSASDMTTLILSYSLMFGLGLGLTYGATINTCVKLFPDRRGFAGGMATAFYGLCSVVLPPIAHMLTTDFGIQRSFEIVGTVCGAVICIGGLLSFLFVGKASGDQKKTAIVGGLTWRQMVSTKRFWKMLFFLCCGAVSGMMIISHSAGIASKQIGLSTALAATAVSYLALINTLGRVAAGTLSDRLGACRTLILSSLLTALGMVTLLFCGKGSIVMFFAALSLIGFSFGSFMGIYPGFTAAAFGAQHNSVNYGIMFAGFSFAGVLGPWIIKPLSAGGSFSSAYLVACCISLIGALAGWIISRQDL